MVKIFILNHFLNDFVFQCLFKNYFKVSNAWIVQPQTVEKKLHAPVIYLNFAKNTEENGYRSCEHFVTYLFYNFSQV